MAKPTTLYDWATTTTYVVVPPSGAQTIGFPNGDPADNGYLNALIKGEWEWLNYLDQYFTSTDGQITSPLSTDLVLLGRAGQNVTMQNSTGSAFLAIDSGGSIAGLSTAPSQTVSLGSSGAGSSVLMQVTGGAATTRLTLDRDSGLASIIGQTFTAQAEGLASIESIAGDVDIIASFTVNILGALASIEGLGVTIEATSSDIDLDAAGNINVNTPAKCVSSDGWGYQAPSTQFAMTTTRSGGWSGLIAGVMPTTPVSSGHLTVTNQTGNVTGTPSNIVGANIRRPLTRLYRTNGITTITAMGVDTIDTSTGTKFRVIKINRSTGAATTIMECDGSSTTDTSTEVVDISSFDYAAEIAHDGTLNDGSTSANGAREFYVTYTVTAVE